MKSKKSNEGYLLVDNSNAPPIPIELIVAAGIPQEMIKLANNKLEAATYTCKHCQKIVILNPLRTRDRGYCPGCDHYVCDNCETIRLIKGCTPIEKVFDQILESQNKEI